MVILYTNLKPAFPHTRNHVHSKRLDQLHDRLHQDQNQDFKTPWKNNQTYEKLLCFTRMAGRKLRVPVSCVCVSTQVDYNPLTLLELNGWIKRNSPALS